MEITLSQPILDEVLRVLSDKLKPRTVTSRITKLGFVRLRDNDLLRLGQFEGIQILRLSDYLARERAR